MVDGQAADWAAAPVLAQSASQSARALKAANEGQNLLVLVQGQGLVGNYNLFLNTDNNSATGHQSHVWAAATGADFMVSNGTLYRSTGPGWSWTPVANGAQVVANGQTIEMAIPFSALNRSGTGAAVSLGFQALTAGWQTDSVLPLVAPLASFALPAARLPVGKGMIIPAYIPLDDAFSWNLLKEGAALMAAGTNPAFKDYWVAVNSGNNGPFSAAADWAKGATVWNPIRSAGGKVFGYVHTCVEPVGPTFRSLDTVKSEITAWVNGYPQLDGIWLDEFYPRFELANVDGAAGPNYPNGLANAPTDRGFVNSANQFNGQQVNPAGGYYDQLVKWVRATYPTLRIIGNAGGAFYSNQLKYADLPDVLVSFEQNLDVASNAPVNNWAGLNRQVPSSASGQLALIHRNSTNLAGAVDQALAKGFTHVYTTNRLLENNIWGGLPPYLMSEIQYLTNRP